MLCESKTGGKTKLQAVSVKQLLENTENGSFPQKGCYKVKKEELKAKLMIDLSTGRIKICYNN